MECLVRGRHPLLYIYYLCCMKNGNAIVMSGIRPTGFLHLGNYFGAMRNYVKLQEEYTCYFMVADLHALTTHPDTKELKENVHRVLAENIACGIDPNKAALYCQSHIRETSELYLYLNMLAKTRNSTWRWQGILSSASTTAMEKFFQSHWPITLGKTW